MTSLSGSVAWSPLTGTSLPCTNLAADQLWSIAGWTMFHYLWTGLVLLLVAAAGRWLLKSALPQIRYAYGLTWLLVLTLLPLGIGAWLASTSAFDDPARNVRTAPSMLSEARTAAGVAANDDAAPTIELNVDAAAAVLADSPANDPHIADSPVVDTPAPIEPHTPSTLAQVGQICDAVAVRLPWLWLVGAPLTFALLATGLVGAERIRRRSRRLNEHDLASAGEVLALCRKLAESMRIGRRVAIGICERISSPILVGIVRPLILLPPAALTGWSAEQIEMVLLHELAHVRRWDNLVNLVQRLIESVLFFQPAVWVVSGWIRTEREHCCDAAVVRHTQRPSAYAQTLAALAVARDTPSADPVLAAGPISAGTVSAMAERQLIRRIRHILNREGEPMQVSRTTLAGLSLALLITVVGVILLPSTVVQANGSAASDSAEPSDTKVATTDEKSPASESNESISEGAGEAISDETSRVDELAETASRQESDSDRYWTLQHRVSAADLYVQEAQLRYELAQLKYAEIKAANATHPDDVPNSTVRQAKLACDLAEVTLKRAKLRTANSAAANTFVAPSDTELSSTDRATGEADLDLREAKLNYEMAKARFVEMQLHSNTGKIPSGNVRDAKLAMEQ